MKTFFSVHLQEYLRVCIKQKYFAIVLLIGQ